MIFLLVYLTSSVLYSLWKSWGWDAVDYKFYQRGKTHYTYLHVVVSAYSSDISF